MLTGTDETWGLEEWNVNTIAHLEPEKPHRAFLTCRVGLSGVKGRGGGEWVGLPELAARRRR